MKAALAAGALFLALIFARYLRPEMAAVWLGWLGCA